MQYSVSLINLFKNIQFSRKFILLTISLSPISNNTRRSRVDKPIVNCEHLNKIIQYKKSINIFSILFHNTKTTAYATTLDLINNVNPDRSTHVY